MFRWALGALALLSAAVGCSPGKRSADELTFAGATLRIIVGSAPGGTHDLHARLVASHLGRHLPGLPKVIVENMPGAGGALASNYLTTVAPPDGLAIGLLNETSAPDVADGRLLDRLALLGSPSASPPVIVFSKRSGITNMDDWRRATRPPRIGSSGPRAVTFVVPRLGSTILGLPAQIVSGYTGTSEIRLALESGEVDGICVSADAIAPLFGAPDMVNLVLRFGTTSIPGGGGVDALTLAADDHARRLLETGVYEMAALNRVFAVRRDVPEPTLGLLRNALWTTWSDASFLADAGVAGLTIAPVGATEVERQVRKVSESTELLTELRGILRAE